MREIEFRAWYDNKELLEVDTLYFEQGKPPFAYLKRGNRKFGQGGCKVELEQFTCLTDKRGIKIFENDIVEITDHTMEEIFEKCGEMVKQFLTRTFLVFWNETKWSIKSLEPEFIPNPPIFDLPVENVTYEVIGNIHTR